VAVEYFLALSLGHFDSINLSQARVRGNEKGGKPRLTGFFNTSFLFVTPIKRMMVFRTASPGGEVSFGTQGKMPGA